MGSSYISLIALKESEKTIRQRLDQIERKKRKKNELRYLHLNKGKKTSNYRKNILKWSK